MVAKAHLVFAWIREPASRGTPVRGSARALRPGLVGAEGVCMALPMVMAGRRARPLTVQVRRQRQVQGRTRRCAGVLCTTLLLRRGLRC